MSSSLKTTSPNKILNKPLVKSPPKNNLITSHTINNPTSWKAQLTDTINDVDELLAMLQLSHEDLQQHNIASYQPKKFPLRVPKSFVAIEFKGNFNIQDVKLIAKILKNKNIRNLW